MTVWLLGCSVFLQNIACGSLIRLLSSPLMMLVFLSPFALGCLKANLSILGKKKLVGGLNVKNALCLMFVVKI